MDSLSQIIQRLNAFQKARGWDKTSSADLAKSIVIEAAELLEHYQWEEGTEEPKEKNLDELSLEAADVFIYLIEFCIHNKIDLLEAVNRKIDKQEKKYPAEMFNGKHNSDFYWKQKAKYRKEEQ